MGRPPPPRPSFLLEFAAVCSAWRTRWRWCKTQKSRQGRKKRCVVLVVYFCPVDTCNWMQSVFWCCMKACIFSDLAVCIVSMNEQRMNVNLCTFFSTVVPTNWSTGVITSYCKQWHHAAVEFVQCRIFQAVSRCLLYDVVSNSVTMAWKQTRETHHCHEAAGTRSCRIDSDNDA